MIRPAEFSLIRILRQQGLHLSRKALYKLFKSVSYFTSNISSDKIRNINGVKISETNE